MQSIDLNSASIPNGDYIPEIDVCREVLKLSDVDSETVSDLSGMFGKGLEADHC